MLQQIDERHLHYEVWELQINQVRPLLYSLSCVAAFVQPIDAVKLAKKLAKKALKDSKSNVWAGVFNTDVKEFYNQYFHNVPIDLQESMDKIMEEPVTN